MIRFGSKKDRDGKASKSLPKSIGKQDYDCSYYGWMSFPIDHIGKISQQFGDAKSLYKIAKRVAETQLKCQQLHGAATSRVVLTSEKFEVYSRAVKLSSPLLSARMDTVISIVAMKSQRLVVIMSYSEDLNGNAAIGVDVLQLDKDKNVAVFVDSFNTALAATKESVPPGVGIKGKKPPPLSKLSEIADALPSDRISPPQSPGSPGWAPDGLSRLQRHESSGTVNYLDVVPNKVAAAEQEHQWDTDSVSSFMIDDAKGATAGYITVNAAGRRITGLGYISVTAD